MNNMMVLLFWSFTSKKTDKGEFGKFDLVLYMISANPAKKMEKVTDNKIWDYWDLLKIGSGE